MYSQCVDGKFVKATCENGLHWNSALRVCDWLKDAKCNNSTTSGIQGSGVQVQSLVAPSKNINADAYSLKTKKGKYTYNVYPYIISII